MTPKIEALESKSWKKNGADIVILAWKGDDSLLETYCHKCLDSLNWAQSTTTNLRILWNYRSSFLIRNRDNASV
jgi:hypothetical protein